MSKFTFENVCEYPFKALENYDTEEAEIGFDTETLGYTRELNIPIYFSWSFKSHGIRYDGAGPITKDEGYEFCKALCLSSRPKIIQNCKADISFMERFDIPIQGQIHDTMLMHALLYEHLKHGLKEVSRTLLGRPRNDAIILDRCLKAQGKKEYRLNSKIPQDIFHKYAVADAVDCFDLFHMLKPRLVEQGLWELYLEVELPVALVYLAIETSGIGCDIDAIERTIPKLLETMKVLENEIYPIYGQKFNLNSPKQLGKQLLQFFPLREKTKKGQLKTGKEILQKWCDDKRMQPILAYKAFSKVESSLRGYKKREREGRLYTRYRQTTKTGRAASADPCLMNIPKQRGRISEVEMGNPILAERCAKAFRLVRSTFKANKGAQLVTRDYEQGEYRVFAYYTNSDRLINELIAGADFHKLVAQLVFEDYNERLRHIVKIISYGLIYGMGPPLLMQTIRSGLPDVNAKDMLQRYERMLPEMRETQNAIKRKGALQGYVTDVFGRRYRYLSDAPHAIVSWLCQGTLANVKKTAMIRVHNILREFRSCLSIDIHDELVKNMYPGDGHLLRPIKEQMEDFPQFGGIPLSTDCAAGPNLLDLKKMNLEEVIHYIDNPQVWIN